MNLDMSAFQPPSSKQSRPGTRKAGSRFNESEEAASPPKSTVAKVIETPQPEKTNKFGFGTFLKGSKHVSSPSGGGGGKEKNTSLSTANSPSASFLGTSGGGGTQGGGGGASLSSHEAKTEGAGGDGGGGGEKGGRKKSMADGGSEKKTGGGERSSPAGERASPSRLTRARSEGRLKGEKKGGEESRKFLGGNLPSLGGAGSAEASPSFASGSISGAGGKAQFGRRAHSATPAEYKRQGPSLLGKGDVVERTAEEVPTLDEGGGGAGKLVEENQRRIREERERVEKQVAEVPAGYQADLPHHTELSAQHLWEPLLQRLHKEFDMSCLTACLAGALDDDIPWNPDMLLVQLTSSLRDAVESRTGADGGGGGGGFGVGEGGAGARGDDDHLDLRLGQMSGGEILRKRKERDVGLGEDGAGGEAEEGGGSGSGEGGGGGGGAMKKSAALSPSSPGSAAQNDKAATAAGDRKGAGSPRGGAGLPRAGAATAEKPGAGSGSPSERRREGGRGDGDGPSPAARSAQSGRGRQGEVLKGKEESAGSGGGGGGDGKGVKKG